MPLKIGNGEGDSAIHIALPIDMPVVYSTEARPSDQKAVSNAFGPTESSILNGSAYGMDVQRKSARILPPP